MVFASTLLAADCCSPCAEGRLFPTAPCHSCGTVWTADISFLAWQALEEGLEFTLNNTPSPLPSNINVNGKLIAPHFPWEPAFKVDLGAMFPQRAWDAQFRWTYFHTNPSRSIHGSLIPLWAFPDTASSTFTSARSHLVLNFNSLDIEVGYHPYLTPALSIRYLVGLKVVGVSQTYHVHYAGGTPVLNASTALTNNAIGAGPRLGFISQWRLGQGFSLLGAIAGSLPLWHYRMERHDHDPNLTYALFRDRFWTFRSILETTIGFGWNTCLGCRGQFPLGLNLNYELQYYAEQNMMPMLVNPGVLSYGYMPRGDLMLHGATFTIHCGF